VHKYAEENREMVNQIEAHERRWAIRLFGLKAPTKKPELIHQSKEVLLIFLKEKLGIDNIKPGEIDTIHRLGPITPEGNQTLLVRFFRRELVDYILASKRLLKGKNASLFQDTTQKNRKLIFDLTRRPEVESAWCTGVHIWAKLHASTKRVQVGITTDLDKILATPENKDETITASASTVLGNPQEQASAASSSTPAAIKQPLEEKSAEEIARGIHSTPTLAAIVTSKPAQAPISQHTDDKIADALESDIHPEQNRSFGENLEETARNTLVMQTRTEVPTHPDDGTHTINHHMMDSSSTAIDPTSLLAFSQLSSTPMPMYPPGYMAVISSTYSMATTKQDKTNHPEDPLPVK
jgi:hypothetical protein